MATILGDSGLIGSFGADFARINHEFFGYLSYLYLFVVGLGFFFLYRRGGFDIRRAELIVAFLLLFFALEIFQATVVTNDFRGSLGADFVDFTAAYIGYFGVWTFFVMAFMLSIVMILDKSVGELIQPMRHMGFKLTIPSMPTFSNHSQTQEEDEIRSIGIHPCLPPSILRRFWPGSASSPNGFRSGFSSTFVRCACGRSGFPACCRGR